MSTGYRQSVTTKVDTKLADVLRRMSMPVPSELQRDGP